MNFSSKRLFLGLFLSVFIQLNSIESWALWSYGPTAVSKFTGNAQPEDVNQLRMMQWNALNHFGNKPKQQLEGLAKTIEKYDPDFLVESEIDSQKTMEDFDRDYMNDSFREILFEGNDSRGIDIGIYVRKDLPYDIEARSFKEFKDAQGTVFRRDAPAFIFRHPKTQEVLMIVIGVHFKSMRDGTGDPLGTKTRTREAQAIVKVQDLLKQEFGDVPILMSGDFNNDVQTAKEFMPIKNVGFKDALELAKFTGDRYTHFYFTTKGKKDFKPLDATFVSAEGQQMKLVKKGAVVAPVDGNGKEFKDPQNIKEKTDPKRPSDHKPTLLLLDAKALLN